jgi:hypothetical protein
MHRFVPALVAAAALGSAAPALSAESSGPTHVVYGIVTQIGANSIVIARRDGSRVSIDIAPAQAAGTTGVLYPNRPIAISGEFDRAGRYHAEAIRSWYELRRGVWPADR